MTDKKDKKPEITWAESIVIEALEPYVDEILKCLAKLANQPGIAGAWVSDRSALSDFLESKPTGKKYPHPLDKRKKIMGVTCDTPENRELIQKLSQELGISIDLHDYLYEIAIRLRDK
jgi:hypothetical protein